jgi:hypothetical protein
MWTIQSPARRKWQSALVSILLAQFVADAVISGERIRHLGDRMKVLVREQSELTAQLFFAAGGVEIEIAGR